MVIEITASADLADEVFPYGLRKRTDQRHRIHYCNKSDNNKNAGLRGVINSKAVRNPRKSLSVGLMASAATFTLKVALKPMSCLMFAFQLTEKYLSYQSNHKWINRPINLIHNRLTEY